MGVDFVTHRVIWWATSPHSPCNRAHVHSRDWACLALAFAPIWGWVTDRDTGCITNKNKQKYFRNIWLNNDLSYSKWKIKLDQPYVSMCWIKKSCKTNLFPKLVVSFLYKEHQQGAPTSGISTQQGQNLILTPLKCLSASSLEVHLSQIEVYISFILQVSLCLKHRGDGYCLTISCKPQATWCEILKPWSPYITHFLLGKFYSPPLIGHYNLELLRRQGGTVMVLGTFTSRLGWLSEVPKLPIAYTFTKNFLFKLNGWQKKKKFHQNILLEYISISISFSCYEFCCLCILTIIGACTVWSSQYSINLILVS